MKLLNSFSMGLFGLTQLANANHFFTLSGEESVQECFIVEVEDEKVWLDVDLKKFKPKQNVFKSGGSGIHLAGLIYRDGDIEESSDAMIKFCDKNAVRLGKCREEHLGKILFTYKQDKEIRTKPRGESFNSLGTFNDFYTFNETGYYCVKFSSLKSDYFEVELGIKTDSNWCKDQKEDRITDIYTALWELVTFLAFYLMWKDEEFKPFEVSILTNYLIYELFASFINIGSASIYVANGLEEPVLLANFRDFFDHFKDFNIIYHLFKVSLMFGYLRPIDLNYFSFFVPFTVIQFFLRVVLGYFHIPYITIIGLILEGIVNTVLVIRTLLRYSQMYKEYKHFNDLKSPVLYQFKMLIFGFLAMIVLIPILLIVSVIIITLTGLLSKDFSENSGLFIDGKEFLGFGLLTHLILSTSVNLLTCYLTLYIWSPQKVKTGVEYKREESTN